MPYNRFIEKVPTKPYHSAEIKDRSKTRQTESVIHIDEESRIDIHLIRHVVENFSAGVPYNRRKKGLKVQRLDRLASEVTYEYVINFLKRVPDSEINNPEQTDTSVFKNTGNPFRFEFTEYTEGISDGKVAIWLLENHIDSYYGDIVKEFHSLWGKKHMLIREY